MSGLISRKTREPAAEKPGPKDLLIKGVRYVNAAAKFWPSLIDEVTQDFSGCTRFELSAACAGLMDRRLLFPELIFEEGLNALANANFDDVMRSTLAELELIGPPSAVQIRLYSDDQAFLHRSLPEDCLDAETFPYLLVWILEWTGVHPSLWNSACVTGDLAAWDSQRGLSYGISFQLANRHLAEGLFERTLSVVHSVKDSTPEESRRGAHS